MASIQGGQGLWGVWCRGTGRDGLTAYHFQITHAGAVRIATPYGGGTPWSYLRGVDVSRPTEIRARCADVPDAPVRLTMSVNGREVLTHDVTVAGASGLLGPGYSGISVLPFSDVGGPIATVPFTSTRLARSS